MKSHKLPAKDIVYITVYIIIAIIALIGAIPEITEFFSPHPELTVKIGKINSTGDCAVHIFNFGDDDATDIKLTVCLINEIGNPIETQSKNIPILPRPPNGKSCTGNSSIFHFDKANLNTDYWITAHIKCDQGSTDREALHIRWSQP